MQTANCKLQTSFIILLFLFLRTVAQTPEESAKSFPWAGGINSAQFCSIDINLDGKKDILIFDRHGNRILPFINTDATPGGIHYAFELDYAALFPDLHDWVQTVDYDHDGKADIFTYGHGGARVFRNVSDTVLKFLLITDLLPSFYYTGKVGILITNVDYPAITDVDGDGDADLLTYFGLGSFVEYHRNISVEKYGNSDSLDFRLENKCWGDFKESIESNEVILNMTCPYKSLQIPMNCSDGTRHTGSSLQVSDLNNDALPDLILGDIGYPGFVTMINGGTRDSAHMISQDTIFPFGSNPVRLFSFPACSFLDVDNDDVKDIIVSPFDPSLNTSENFHSCWFYKYEGSNSNPEFVFKKERFFQDEMIDLGSGAYPVLEDIDGDGLTDLISGNYGYYDSSWYEYGILHSSFISKIAYYRNTGTLLHPAFTLMTGDLASLSELKTTGLSPACGDIDGDGKKDLIVGKDDGTLLFLKNKGTAGPVPEFERPVADFQHIDAGEYSATQLFDLDQDGLIDLIVGEKGGNLNYYRNTGTTTNPVFSLMTDSLGKINVTNHNLSYDGYSTPCFFRMNNGETRLLIGSEEGKLHYYSGIDGNLNGTFQPDSSLGSLITGDSITGINGIRISPAIAKLTSEGYFDLILGNYSGGLNYFSKEAAPSVITAVPNHLQSSVPVFRINPNPSDKYFVISTDEHLPFRISLFDVNGKEIFHQQYSENQIIDVSNLRDGFYLLKISPLSLQFSFKPFISKVIILH